MTSDDSTGTVLVIEDDPLLTELYTEFLEENYTVYQAHDGEEGLERIDESVDVVLLDRRMPGLSGDEVLDELRRRGDNCQIAMVTAVDPDFDVIEMGFDEYITKPVDRERLNELVDELLVRSAYDSAVREFLSLAAKRSALEVNKTGQELEENDEYVELCEEMATLRQSLDAELDELDAAGYDALFHGLER